MAKYILIISAICIVVFAALKVLTESPLFSFGISLGAIVFVVSLVYLFNSLSGTKTK